jgi:hypothetical protein
VDVGFQYPIGDQYESIARGWWSEGWSFFYDKEDVGFTSRDDVWGSVALTSPSITYKDVDMPLLGKVYKIRFYTGDGKVMFTFEFP